MKEIALARRSTEQFRAVLSDGEVDELAAAMRKLLGNLSGRSLWHVNSTSTSGGVAELLAATLPYCVGADIDVHWLVVDADPSFFEVTKRLHNRLHEDVGDGGDLGAHERDVYEHAMERERPLIAARVAAGDVVVLHDPQTLGLAPALAARGALVVWRCHIGVDEPGPLAREAWNFLREDLRSARLCVFSRAQYIWEGLLPQAMIMPPCIDVLSLKNRAIDPSDRDAILKATGIVTCDGPLPFVGASGPDGKRILVQRQVTGVEEGPVPPDVPLVVQVSRWDRLKDPVGLLNAFVADTAVVDLGAHLVVAGPQIQAIADDPEDAVVFGEVREAWRALPLRDRRRVHLSCLPIDDLEENALIVNALQSRADVVAQKSLVEGFGLTVTEAMWKSRPVVAGRVGGIQDQIVNGESGILVDDPSDDPAFGHEIGQVLAAPARAQQIGAAAHQRVRDHFSPVRYLQREASLYESLVA